jgi:hypothetical protein
MAAHRAGDFRSEVAAPGAQGIDVLAEAAHLVAVGRSVIAAHGHTCRCDECLGESRAHEARPVITAQSGQGAKAGLVEGAYGRIGMPCRIITCDLSLRSVAAILTLAG